MSWTDWELTDLPPDAADRPDHPAFAAAAWRPARVPGTVASSLGMPAEDGHTLLSRDWWFRARFAREGLSAGPVRLRFEGLATLCEAWLDAEPLLRSEAMFTPVEVERPAPPAEGATLWLRFRALGPALAARRPRPRWRTALVEAQNLRWIRTCLVGHIPGWTPPLPAVGPWRAVTVEEVGRGELRALRVQATLDGELPTLRLRGELHGEARDAWAEVLGERHPLPTQEGRFDTTLRLPDAPRWWPHTHGEPALVEVAVGAEGAATLRRRVGFRRVEVDREGGAWRYRVNGRALYVRGACWTPVDVPSLDGTPAEVHLAVARAVEAGANMLRVGGTMTWESDTFYEACDEAGVLVWQDLPFANLDYPLADPAFAATVRAELDAQLQRLHHHPCLATWCGGSEIEQQAAMLGLGREDWSQPFFQEEAPARCEAATPGLPWAPNTPTGGALPFHTSEGLTHYYGVGAYRRPLTDTRRAQVRFSPESLGFSNVPGPEVVDTLGVPPHHPHWKAGVPRDNGAGWDFEDVRDHYLKLLYGLDPVELRWADRERWLRLSRVVTGELMLRVHAEWRRPGSGCGGGLVWLWKDLGPGAGWGLLDHAGRPKAAWWYLRRAWAARAVLLTDEGLDGVGVHLHNEHPEPFEGTLQLELYRDAQRSVGRVELPLRLDPWSAETRSGDTLFGRFTDLTWAYRFGPPGHDVVAARLLDGAGRLVHDDALFPVSHLLPRRPAAEVQVQAEVEQGVVRLRVESAGFLQAATVHCPGWTSDLDHFHLHPGVPRELRLRPTPGGRLCRGSLEATNLEGPVSLRVEVGQAAGARADSVGG